MVYCLLWTVVESQVCTFNGLSATLKSQASLMDAIRDMRLKMKPSQRLVHAWHEVVKRKEGEKINYVQIHCHRYLVCCHCWSLLRGTPIDSIVYVYFF